MVHGDLFLVVKAVLLLVVSFFVLVVVTKTDSKSLKTFGRILAITLWIISASAILYAMFSDYSGRYNRMHKEYFKSKTMKCW